MSKYKRLEKRLEELEKELNENSRFNIFWRIAPETDLHFPTIKGKLDAIIEHLGIKIEVKPSQSAKVVARKIKK